MQRHSLIMPARTIPIIQNTGWLAITSDGKLRDMEVPTVQVRQARARVIAVHRFFAPIAVANVWAETLLVAVEE